MFIQTESTPNPATLKFIPGREVMPMGSGSADFPNAASADGKSPLAWALFDIDGVAGVFLGSDFITVTKSDSSDLDWHHLKPAILAAIMDHFTAGRPVMAEGASGFDQAAHDDELGPPTTVEDYEGADREVVEQIMDLLDTRIRPAVANDGGDILFHSFREGIVFLHMQGACAGCPASTMTLKQGIENMMRHYIPDVEAVEPVGVDPEIAGAAH